MNIGRYRFAGVLALALVTVGAAAMAVLATRPAAADIRPAAGAARSAIYGGGPFYSGGQAVMDDLRGSGFTTVVLRSIHVDAHSGDLAFNDTRIVSNGPYVGDPGWPAGCVRSDRRPPR